MIDALIIYLLLPEGNSNKNFWKIWMWCIIISIITRWVIGLILNKSEFVFLWCFLVYLLWLNELYKSLKKDKNKIIKVTIDKNEAWKTIDYKWHEIKIPSNVKIWDKIVVKWEWFKWKKWSENWDLIYIVKDIE